MKHLPLRGLAAILAVGGFAGMAAATEAKANPFANISPGEGFAYFSGNTPNNHNHPAIFAYQGEVQKLVVIGRGYREEFPLAQSDKAFRAYRALLKANRYKVGDRASGSSPLRAPETK